MNDAIASIPWTDRQWDLVQQAVRHEAERTRIPGKSLRAAKADATDVAVPAYALGPSRLPLASDPAADAALRKALEAAAGGNKVPVDAVRTNVNSDPTLYLTTLSKLVYLRNREIADAELESALTYFRRAGAELAQAENALFLNGRTLDVVPRAPAGVIVNQLPPAAKPVRGLYAPAGVPGQHSPRLVPIHQPGDSAISFAGRAAAEGGEVVAALSRATAQLETAAYHAPFTMVASTSLWTAINQPSAQSLIPARPAIERILEGGPLMHSDALPPGVALVFAHDCPELEQVVARDIGVKYLHTTAEPRFVFRVSVRTALRVRDRSAIAILFFSGNQKADGSCQAAYDAAEKAIDTAVKALNVTRDESPLTQELEDRAAELKSGFAEKHKEEFIQNVMQLQAMADQEAKVAG